MDGKPNDPEESSKHTQKNTRVSAQPTIVLSDCLIDNEVRESIVKVI
jgi:hypothetical protein